MKRVHRANVSRATKHRLQKGRPEGRSSLSKELRPPLVLLATIGTAMARFLGHRLDNPRTAAGQPRRSIITSNMTAVLENITSIRCGSAS
jgi:hypothetical protein